ncbi:MAG TPA: amino acid racemase [Sphingomicrobium sp.]|nr:amino acid racemase [Sphingomicrobium sp.]
MKHIGILAHSFEGAGLCFRTACLEGVKRLGAHMHPEITMTCSPMALVLEAWECGENEQLRAFFMEDATKLAAAGCDFFVCPDNTAHIALETPGEPFPIPGLHIGEVVAEKARQDARTRVGILGTRFTMTGPVYPGALGRRGIGWAVPDEADRKTVDDIIFDELCLGTFKDESRNAYVRIIEELKGDGCDAVALVCTEIPLLIGQNDSSLPILDSTRLLAAAAVEVALGDKAMPEWRGGPI